MSTDDFEKAISTTWYNELGSMMELTAKGGQLSGRYNSTSGAADGWYKLVGLYDSAPLPDNFGTSLTWTVQWNNDTRRSQSNTAWNGQFHANNGNPYIRVMWMLSHSTIVREEWRSIWAGLDNFTPVKPTEQEVKAKLATLTAFANGHPV